MQHMVNSKSIKSKQSTKSTSEYLHLIFFFTTDKSVISFTWVFTKFSVPYWFSQCETNHKWTSIKACLTVMIHMFWNLLIFCRHSTQEPASDQLLVMMSKTFSFHGNLHEKAVLTASATLSEVLLLFFTGGSKSWFHELPVSTKVPAICDNQGHNRKRGSHHTVPHKGPREIY